MRNEQVVKAWKEGRTATNYSVTLHTDGVNLWSYNLLIGTTNEDGQKVVHGYAKVLGGPVVSQTTSNHVLLAAREAADLVAVLEDGKVVVRLVEDFQL